jgi:hypothetical protein
MNASPAPTLPAHAATKAAVTHLAELLTRYQLDGEDFQTLVTAVDHDGLITPEIYWGEGLTDTFTWVTHYATSMGTSAAALVHGANVALGR